MKTVKFSGLRPKGTMRPRRLWNPGDILRVDDDVAEEILRETGFSIVRSRSRKEEH